MLSHYDEAAFTVHMMHYGKVSIIWLYVYVGVLLWADQEHMGASVMQ